ncbi:hypothetical protein ES692_12555 [Psychroserpens burtonensis]|uniref:Uncharacterized protein n=1 Tax=Psychroserpens burtonensis TaxID=49278 RepID=A0A5C7B4S8_9FLAO|nr:hypothetical protein [Psychroserpens burtonensis]TXE16600.1 hypothetical protein ES692_12555 [Psychroserpens burtonensis]
MEKPLKDKHSELIHRLYKPLIFYLPRRVWADVNDKFLDKEFDTVFNTIILMRENGDNYILNNGLSNFYLLGKASSLDKNIYELLDLKVKLTSEAFQFLSERYSLSVAFYKHVSNWMVEHVKDDISDCSEETINSFEFQKLTFAKHWDYIQKHFSVPDHIKNYFDNAQLTTQNISKIPDFITGEQLQTKRIFEKLVKPRIIKKTVLITDEDAEKFLLETVFNIKL